MFAASSRSLKQRRHCFNDADVDAVITQHLAYSPSLESIDALMTIKAPLIVFDTTPDYDLIARASDL